MFKSIRWRLLAWQSGILFLAVAGFGAALYYQIRQARFARIDGDLQAAARVLDGALRGFPPYVLDGAKGPPPPGGPPDFRPPGGPPDDFRPPFPGGPPGPPPRPGDQGPPPPPDGRPNRDWEAGLSFPQGFAQRFADNADDAPYFVVWLADGRVLKATPLPPGVPAPELPPFPAAAGGDFEFRQRRDLREIVLAGPHRSLVLVGRSIRREQADLSWLAVQLLATGLVVLAAGGAGGWWLSRRAVRPILAMGSTAAAISAANLRERIAVNDWDSELGALATTLNEMFGRLEAAFERQTRFTADASHELRTPLSVIQSHAELALSRPRSPVEYQEALTACLRASRRMKSIVEGLLTLARADAGSLEMRRLPFDAGAVVRDAAAQVAPLAAQRKVCLSVQAPRTEISGDAARLSQVVVHLLTNAILYNRAGGQATATLHCDGGEAVLTVADTGHGIPEADRAHLFERFHRVDKARTQGGNGLGLAVCKSVVEALGGSITFTTESGRGATFVVRIPVEKEPIDSQITAVKPPD